MTGVSEQLYSFGQIGQMFNISRNLVGKLFRDRPGVLNMAHGVGRPSYRVPAALLIDVMRERGYTQEQAESLLNRLSQQNPR